MAGAIALFGVPAAAQPGDRAPSDLRAALSAAAQEKLDWVRQTADNQRLAFAVIDKQEARIWLFDADAAFLGSSPVLLGAARGDHTVPGIGDRPMSQIRPEERTTPAGRFVAEAGINGHGEDIFWVDYDAAVSIHRVRAVSASERRLQRLASSTPLDNRISYGCINVPVMFYEQVLQPAFVSTRAVVYVLPENALADTLPAQTGPR